jgi:hypothetical protein
MKINYLIDINIAYLKLLILLKIYLSDFKKNFIFYTVNIKDDDIKLFKAIDF